MPCVSLLEKRDIRLNLEVFAASDSSGCGRVIFWKAVCCGLLLEWMFPKFVRSHGSRSVNLDFGVHDRIPRPGSWEFWKG